MRMPPPPQTPEQWLSHLFSAKAARDGGVVRRNLRDMERVVGRELFLAEIHRRGFTAVENAGQVVVFCNARPVRLISAGPRRARVANPQEDLTAEFR